MLPLMLFFCQSSDMSNLQTNESLKPSLWFENVFVPYSEKVFDQMIQIVISELNYDEIKEEYVDHVSYSEVLDRYPDKRVCPNCAKMCPKDVDKCMFCGYQCSYTNRAECYGDVPSGYITKANIEIGEFIPVNPNSRENMLQVMTELTKQCELGTKRAWVRFGCDGLPYNIA